jgi:hypothetical protein
MSVIMIWLGVAVVAFAGVTAYVKLGAPNPKPAAKNGDLVLQDQSSGHERLAPDLVKPKDGVNIPQPRYEDGELKLDTKTQQVPADADPYLYSVNQFLVQSKVAPKDAKLLRAELHDHTLELHFNKEFDRTYGADDESTLVNGILATCSQFDGVNRVQFFIDNQPMETMGNVDLTQPLDVSR